MKICTRCQIEKSLESFPTNRRICKDCKKKKDAVYIKKWRENPENRKKHLATMRSCSQNWKKANPEKVLSYNRTRRALISGATATLTIQEENEVWNEFNRKCFWCNNLATQLEHIVPLRPRLGELQGHHVKSNVVPSCQSCNSKKLNKDPLIFLFQTRDPSANLH